MRAFRVLVQAVCLILVSAPLVARETPTISSISPTTIHVRSGEWFMRINGTRFLPLSGLKVVFSSGWRETELHPSAGTDTSLDVWVPLSIVNSAGHYSVFLRATDAQGTVQSEAMPFVVSGSSVILHLPQYVVWEALTRAGAVVRFDVTATSQFGEVSVKCSRYSGELYPIEKTTVDCDATDDFGGSASGSFAVSVQDTTPPAFKLPREMVAFGKEGAYVSYEVSAYDLVDDQVKVACFPESGSFMRVGTNSVTCEASDSRGNTEKGSFRVHVGDDVTPALIVPEGVSAEAESREGAYVRYEATASDSQGNAVPVDCSIPSGSLFPFGASTVTCVAKARGTATRDFEVMVADTSAPFLSLPRAVTVEATKQDGAFVKFDVSAKDAVDLETRVVCSASSGDFFPVGVTSVSCSAYDSWKNVTHGTFEVTVTPYPDDTVYLRAEPDDPTEEPM